jgi:DNA helicase HerA-like ATPase
MHQGAPVDGLQVRAPLKMFNRHGLIAGATGTGKTKSLQVLAEELSLAGVPVLLMDLKGDISGLARGGTPHPKAEERAQHIGFNWAARGFPVEFLTLSQEPGTRLKATVTEFGPVLLAKVLELNDNQEGLLALVFKYCDDRSLPLVDLKDLRTVLQYISGPGKEEADREYGLVSSATAGAILRKLLQLEEQGADAFFGEPSFEVKDLLQRNGEGLGVIHVLRLTDIQDRPRLFSTFMMALMAEVFQKFPERGDLDKPELVIFIDEAHLFFKEASQALLQQLDSVVKLIRSKGVGLFFVTQVPEDIPQNILSQLGFKLQHALRAFTAKDRKAIRLVAQNYPETDFYNVEEVLTQMGIGEALVTVLNDKGIPTALVHTLMRPPLSRMDILQPDEIQSVVNASQLTHRYNREIDQASAHEMLRAKMQGEAPVAPVGKSSTPREEPNVVQEMLESRTGQTLVREITRALFGMLGLGGSTTRRRTTARRRY